MSNSLRIGLFVIAFPRVSETFIVTKVLKLLDHGFDVQIFTLSGEGDWSNFKILDDRPDIKARIHAAPARSLVAGSLAIVKNITRSPQGLARLAAHRWHHRSENPVGFLKALYEHTMFAGHALDILHIEFDYQGIGIADLKEYFGCRLLLSSRGFFQRTSTYRPEACEYLFRYVDGYHFISKSLDNNTHRLGLPAEVPCWHVEPAIDLGLFLKSDSFRVHTPPLRIVSVGRLVWSKGYEFAIDAVAKLRDRGIDFVYKIYGSGPYEQAVRFAIREYALEDRVEIVGALPRHEIPKILANADIMLHAAIDEGFCNAVIEAQAMELPVVTTDAGGLPENVAHEVTGFVVPRRNAAALADKLAVLASDPELRRRLGAAGRQRALERFDLDRQADAFVRLYRELMDQPRRGAP